MPSFKKIFCAALLSLFLALPAQAAEFSAKEMKVMGVFLSNFTEIRFMNVEAEEFLDEADPAGMIRFGVWHNYVNNFKSRIRRCADANCKWGSLTIDGKYVRESVKRYFGYELKKLPSVDDADNDGWNFHFDGKLYHFEGADGEATYYADVMKAQTGKDGLVRMSGEVYNAEDRKDVSGTFKAIARPHTWNGKKTWALVTLQTTFKD